MTKLQFVPGPGTCLSARGVPFEDHLYGIRALSSDLRVPKTAEGLFEIENEGTRRVTLDAASLAWLEIEIRQGDLDYHGPARFNVQLLQSDSHPDRGLERSSLANAALSFEHAPYLVPFPVGGTYRVGMNGGVDGRSSVASDVVNVRVGEVASTDFRL